MMVLQVNKHQMTDEDEEEWVVGILKALLDDRRPWIIYPSGSNE